MVDRRGKCKAREKSIGAFLWAGVGTHLRQQELMGRRPLELLGIKYNGS